ncbi:hypothetical protein COU54_00085 [Candidatus Pacearchaeota archaeon CG10_big_fil_rev_8_21_14_0_10_31_24]|nr:MAG: hypothetical protein COU54_00085 [Candidatus Pacearchaeota archaeon CG10_big_fil_rev_8_21_14_0_10_31_24]
MENLFREFKRDFSNPRIVLSVDVSPRKPHESFDLNEYDRYMKFIEGAQFFRGYFGSRVGIQIPENYASVESKDCGGNVLYDLANEIERHNKFVNVFKCKIVPLDNFDSINWAEHTGRGFYNLNDKNILREQVIYINILYNDLPAVILERETAYSLKELLTVGSGYEYKEVNL